MLNYKELTEIVHNCLDRFRYASDIKNYGKREHWPLFSEIPDEGIFKDDCDGFAQMVRKELHKRGEESIIQTVGINSRNINHAACRYGEYIIDNMHSFPMSRSQLPGWTFISHSNPDLTRWYKTI